MADQEVTVIIGSGHGSRYRESHPRNNKSKGPNPGQTQGKKGPNKGHRRPWTPPEMIRVHNGPNNFVGEISIRTLVRFSWKAGKQFPKPKPEARQGAQTGKTEPSTQQPTIPEPQTTGSTGILTPEIAPVASGSKGKAPARLQGPVQNHQVVAVKQARKPESRTFELTNDAVLMPTNGAILKAIDWMKDNARLQGKRSLTTFGPADLRSATFERVLDAYQTALVFGIRPFPHHLRDDLIKRIDSEEPTLERMKMLNECLPLHDLVLQEIMEMHDRCYMMRGYSQAEVDEFNAYIFSEGNERFAKKLEYLGRCRKRARKTQRAEAQRAETGHRQNLATRGNARTARGGRAA